jgi:replicative DNA helicase
MTQAPLLQAIDAEEAVVAAILLDDREVVAEGVTSLLTPEMFVDGPCRAAYRAYLSLREQKQETTIITVIREWTVRGWIDAVDRETGNVGAEPWLADVVGKHWTAYGTETHARIIRDLWERRTQFQQAQEMARKAFEGPVVERGVKVRGLKRYSA